MAALTAALLGATALSGVSQAMGQRREGQIAVAAGNAEGQQYGLAASLEDAKAADALARGNEAVGRQQLANKQLRGEQRVAFAGQGVDVNTGSAAEVQAGDQTIGEFDTLTLRNNAMREAWGFQTQGALYRYQGDQARLAGRNRQKAYNSQAISTVLTTAASVGDTYLKNRSTTTAPTLPRIGSSSPSPSASNGGYRSGTASP